jgi:predicted HTH transcriptional regulator
VEYFLDVHTARAIGVSDSGEINGIQRDLDLAPLAQRNKDKFELRIRNCLRDRFKPPPLGKVNISFEELPKGTVCRVDVQKASEIMHLDNEVYVRDGNKTEKLEGHTLTSWIQQRTNQ